MSEQLVLDLPHRPAMGADDFLVSGCNEGAIAIIDAWPDWDHPVQLIEGPPGSGKSHLANVWRLKTGALSLDPEKLNAERVTGMSLQHGIVLENLDCCTFDEQALFHLLNLSRERSFNVLLTSRTPPSRWNISLPDLISRLRALPVAKIGMPDDALLGAVLLKHFSDRQLNVEPQVLKFLAHRTTRSMNAVRELAAAIDHAALVTGKKVTRHFAGEILEKFQTDENTTLD